MTSFDTSKIKGQATGLDKRLFEDHNFLYTTLDGTGTSDQTAINTLADGLDKTNNNATATLETAYTSTSHATFLHEVIDELADGFDIPQEIKDEIITQAKNNLGNGATLNDMINEIVTILEAADDDTANEIDRDIILQQDVSNTTSNAADNAKFSTTNFSTPNANNINQYISVASNGTVKESNEYTKETHADIMTKSGGVIDKMTLGFTFSGETKQRLLNEAIEVAKDTKLNPTVSEIVTALATVLERYDNNAKDTNDGNTPKDKALSRDTLIKNGLQNTTFGKNNFDYGTETTGKKLAVINLFNDNTLTLTSGASTEYNSKNTNIKTALNAGIDKLVTGLSPEIKKALIDEAYSMGDPSTASKFTVMDIMDNIAKILERHDNEIGNKGDVVHNDNAVLWTNSSTIEKMAGVTNLDTLFKLFNPTTGASGTPSTIKTADASTYFSNLLEELNTDSSGDNDAKTKIVSQGDLNKIIKDIAGTDGKMSIDEFTRIVQVMEVKSGQEISSNVKAGTNLAMKENGDGMITGSIAENDNQAAGFNIDTALGFTNVKGILDYLDADDDGNIVKTKAINFITSALSAANGSIKYTEDSEEVKKIKALVNAITGDNTTNNEVVNAAELEKIMAFSEAMFGKNLFDSVDGSQIISNKKVPPTYNSTKYGSYTYDSEEKTGIFTDVTATKNPDSDFLNETVAAMLTGVTNRGSLGFSDNGYSERSSHILVESQNKEAMLDRLRERIKEELKAAKVNDAEAEIIIQAALANLQNARAAKGSTKGKFADITVGNLYREVENIMQGDSAEYETATSKYEVPNIAVDFKDGTVDPKEVLFNKLIASSDASNGYLHPDVVKDFLIGYTKSLVTSGKETEATKAINALVDANDGNPNAPSMVSKTEFNTILTKLNADIKDGNTQIGNTEKSNGFNKKDNQLGLPTTTSTPSSSSSSSSS